MEVFDWYELVTYDVHCQQRGMVVAQRRMASVVRDGLGIYTGVNFFGMNDEPNAHPDYGPAYGNLNMKPDLTTLTGCARSTGGRGRMGHVICDLELLDGEKDVSSPRTVAQLQLSKLRDLGFSLKSSSEVEFDVRDSQTGENFGHTGSWASINVLDSRQDLFLELTDELEEINVKVDTLQCEAGPGQYEVTMDIAEGIKGPDSTARFKNASKTFFAKRHLAATFMTKVSLDGISSGMHFNHSLWKDGESVFRDDSQDNHLSELGQHWMAGLLLHSPAITALSCPTVNCYRRIGSPWAPTYANWGLQDRMSTIRLKVEGQGRNVYLENRIPSAASNPYLVMAATVAAGMDGIERKLPLPPAGETSVKLPQSLPEALTQLEKDEVMVAALGKELVKQFVYCKREFEIEKLKNYGDQLLFKKEYEMYFKKA